MEATEETDDVLWFRSAPVNVACALQEDAPSLTWRPLTTHELDASFAFGCLCQHHRRERGRCN